MVKISGVRIAPMMERAKTFLVRALAEQLLLNDVLAFNMKHPIFVTRGKYRPQYHHWLDRNEAMANRRRVQYG